MKKFIKKLTVSATLLAGACFAVSPVCALGSIQANGTTSGEVKVHDQIVEGSTSYFSDDFSYLNTDSSSNEAKAAYAAITSLNDGSKTLATALSGKDIKVDDAIKNFDIKDFSMLTKIQDLNASDADKKALTEDVTVTWEVPNLTKDVQDVYVLHFSTQRNIWEVLNPETVDYSSKQITCHFDDLSPVSVIYRTNASAPSEGTNTGTQTNTGMYVAVAGLAAIAVIVLVVANKKKHQN